MATKGRLSKEQKESNNENISKIINLTTQIKEIVTVLHGESCKTAYLKSVENLEKKNEKYLVKEPFRISEEEKELIIKMREEKEKISEVFGPETGEDESNAEISESEDVEHENKKTTQKKARR